jgi:hypothetical protein
MKTLLQTADQFLLSLSPNIYINIVFGCFGIVVLAIGLAAFYSHFKSVGEKYETTPLGGLFVTVTMPIAIPLVLLWTIGKPAFPFLRRYFEGLLFFIAGLFKIMLRGVGNVIRLGKGESSRDMEKEVIRLIGAITTLERELSGSEAKRRILLDNIAGSLGGSFEMTELPTALVLLLYTTFEHQGYDKALLSNIAIEKTIMASAERIHDLMVVDLFDDDIPF